MVLNCFPIKLRIFKVYKYYFLDITIEIYFHDTNSLLSSLTLLSFQFFYQHKKIIIVNLRLQQPGQFRYYSDKIGKHQPLVSYLSESGFSIIEIQSHIKTWIERESEKGPPSFGLRLNFRGLIRVRVRGDWNSRESLFITVDWLPGISQRIFPFLVLKIYYTALCLMLLIKRQLMVHFHFWIWFFATLNWDETLLINIFDLKTR